MTYKLDLPTSVKLGKNEEPWALNLNVYRNAHFRVLAAAKIKFREVTAKAIKPLPVFDMVQFHYVLFTKGNYGTDTMNVVSIVSKFFEDCFVTSKKLPDDNHKYVTRQSMEFGGIDKTNPRCEVYITGTLHEEESMQLIFDQKEIMLAMVAFAKTRINIGDEEEFAFDFKAGRGESGMTCTVEVIAKGGDVMAAQIKASGGVMGQLNDGPVMPKRETVAERPAPTPTAFVPQVQAVAAAPVIAAPQPAAVAAPAAAPAPTPAPGGGLFSTSVAAAPVAPVAAAQPAPLAQSNVTTFAVPPGVAAAQALAAQAKADAEAVTGIANPALGVNLFVEQEGVEDADVIQEEQAPASLPAGVSLFSFGTKP